MKSLWRVAAVVAVALSFVVVGPASPASAASCPVGPTLCYVGTHANTCATTFFGNNYNGLLVAAEMGATGNYYAMMRARSSSEGPWEEWAICNLNGYVSFQNQYNGLYAAAEMGATGSDYAMLRARSSSVGAWEKFSVSCNGNLCSIQSQYNHLYVAAEMGATGSRYAMLRARSSSVGPWELWF